MNVKKKSSIIVRRIGGKIMFETFEDESTESNNLEIHYNMPVSPMNLLTYIFTYYPTKVFFTLYPEDLKWQPRFVKVDFIRMQNALSHVGFPDMRSTLACINDVTG